MNAIHSAALAILVFLLATGAHSAAPPKAFDDRAVRATPTPPERGERRARAVRLRSSLFDAPAATRFQKQQSQSKAAPPAVTMNFFPDAALRVRWSAATVDPATGTVEWTGSIEGASMGSAVLIVNGRRLTGNFSRGDGITYQVRTDAKGAIWVRELHQSAFPPELAPRAGPQGLVHFHRQPTPPLADARNPHPSRDSGPSRDYKERWPNDVLNHAVADVESEQSL